MTDATNRQCVADLSADLQGAVARIYRRVRSETQDDQLGGTQSSVLSHVVKHGPQALRALSERERVSPPAMNQTVNALQDAGLVTRRPDPNDGRKVLIAATDAGRALTFERRRLKHQWLITRLEHMTDHEREVLAEAALIFNALAES
ncbi:MarR family winged helix-turn-helix transcriptional regulator [Actinacidiphila sp. bgisy144]|uniref:MarR family winged helix-turn-helix transcriptional regulator n=1 Tax=unclassified Actinacidiphila TaxID=2995708 RepID=UPI003EBC6103